jgi:hypothetical protein
MDNAGGHVCSVVCLAVACDCGLPCSIAIALLVLPAAVGRCPGLGYCGSLAGRHQQAEDDTDLLQRRVRSLGSRLNRIRCLSAR